MPSVLAAGLATLSPDGALELSPEPPEPMSGDACVVPCAMYWSGRDLTLGV